MSTFKEQLVTIFQDNTIVNVLISEGYQSIDAVKVQLQKPKDQRLQLLQDKNQGTIDGYIAKLLTFQQQQAAPQQQSLKRFWVYLGSEEVKAKVEQSNVLDFSVNPFNGFKTTISKLHIRDSYKEIYKLVNDNEKTSSVSLVGGNPGIGKSMFLFYYLYQKRLTGKSVILDSLGVNANYIYYFTSTSGIYNVDIFTLEKHGPLLLSNNNNTIYLADGKQPLQCRIPVVIASSPQKENYERYMKSTSSPLRAMMPILTVDEIHEIKNVIYTEQKLEEVDARFYKWGGIPRYIFEQIDPSSQFELIKAIAKTDLDACFKSINQPDSPSTGSHKVIHIDVLPNTNYVQQSIVFGSNFIKKKLFQRFYWRWTNDLINNMKSASYLSSTFGSGMFEQLAHQTLCFGGTFKVRALEKTPANMGDRFIRVNDSEFTLKIEQCEFKEFLNTEEIVGAQQNHYLRPYSQHFPATDSMVLPNYLFQMTVSQRHPIVKKELSFLLDKLDTEHKNPFFLIFVVPTSEYKDFKVQDYVVTTKRPVMVDGKEKKNEKGETVYESVKVKTESKIDQITQFVLSLDMTNPISPEELCPVLNEEDKYVTEDFKILDVCRLCNRIE